MNAYTVIEEYYLLFWNLHFEVLDVRNTTSNHMGENENFTQKMKHSVAFKELLDVRKNQILVLFLWSIASKIELF